MIKEAKNKMIKNENEVEKVEVVKEKNKFHFSGSTKFAPMTIEADNYEEALKILESKRSDTIKVINK